MDDFDDDDTPFSTPVAPRVPMVPERKLGRMRLPFVLLPILALGLVVVLAGIPTEVPPPDQCLAKGQHLVTETIAIAQTMAITTGRQHAIVFDPNENHFYIIDPARGVAIHPSTGKLAIIDLPDHHLELAAAKFGPSSTLVFEVDGRPRDSGQIELTSQGQMRRFVFDRETAELRPK